MKCNYCESGDHSHCRDVERVWLLGVVVCNCNCEYSTIVVDTFGQCLDLWKSQAERCNCYEDKE